MKIFLISVFALSTVAGAASAAQTSLSDTEYLRASRCAGLAKTLSNVVDGDQLAKVVRAERGARSDYIVGRAGDLYEQARREAKKESRRERLSEELTGACSAFLGGPAALAKK